ncbi:MAG: DUF934 domain-containing protein [Proteobacteria bacterium]|nr:MAG: DUF934 domain-containing protein [Pseudomonadota bacterium]
MVKETEGVGVSPQQTTMEVDTELPIPDLLARAADVARVVIRVASLTDGRVFSQVRALIDDPSFAGAIEVRGDLLPEQGEILSRYGVSEVVLENGLDLDDGAGYLRQADYGNILPARANRVAPGALS